MSVLDLILKPAPDMLPLGAPVLIGAAMGVTGWLSYRRILKKHPAQKRDEAREISEHDLVKLAMERGDPAKAHRSAAPRFTEVEQRAPGRSRPRTPGTFNNEGVAESSAVPQSEPNR